MGSRIDIKGVYLADTVTDFFLVAWSGLCLFSCYVVVHYMRSVSIRTRIENVQLPFEVLSTRPQLPCSCSRQWGHIKYL